MTKTVFAIKDTHSDPAGRNRAKAILESGGVRAFFIEWPKPIDKGAIVRSFEGLAKGDAEPSLVRLATIAITKGIDVISCDLTVSATVAALNALNDGYGPYSDSSAFQPWGKGIRDRHAAGVIRNYMLIHPDNNCRGLVMFGSDHFESEDGRNADPLHKLIRARHAIDCFIVDNNSSDVSF